MPPAHAVTAGTLSICHSLPGFPCQTLLLWRHCHSLPVWERAGKELLLGLVCHWDVLSEEDGDEWHH